MSVTRPVIGHLSPEQVAEARARLDEGVEQSDEPGGCWYWRRAIASGYGRTHVGRKSDGTFRNVGAHQLAYALAKGDPAGSIDHLCHDNSSCRGGTSCPHRSCCNPAHLADVPINENARRASQGRRAERCRRGHLWQEETTYYEPTKGRRRCRICLAEKDQRRRSQIGKAPGQRAARRRPRGLSRAQIVDWGLEGEAGPGCWAWAGRPVGEPGYVHVTVDKTTKHAHRLVYEMRLGAVEAGDVVDHVCHDPSSCPGGPSCPHRSCVNPDHLRAVPQAVNSSVERAANGPRTHCQRGHEYTDETTSRRSDGYRVCKVCRKAGDLAWARKAGDRLQGVDRRFRIDGRCRNGHVIEEVGLTSKGGCAECQRISGRKAYRARRAR